MFCVKYWYFKIVFFNYVYGIYDGDGSVFNFFGLFGFDVFEVDFEEFYEFNGEVYVFFFFIYCFDYVVFIENGIFFGGFFIGVEVFKIEEEVEFFGGEVGVVYDVNYYFVGDNMDNFNFEVYFFNIKSIVNFVVKYVMSWEIIFLVDIKKRRLIFEIVEMIKCFYFLVYVCGYGYLYVYKGFCGGGDIV